MGDLEERQIAATDIAKATKLLMKERRDLGSWCARHEPVGCYCSYRAHEIRDSNRSNNITNIIIIIIISITSFMLSLLLMMMLLLLLLML